MSTTIPSTCPNCEYMRPKISKQYMEQKGWVTVVDCPECEFTQQSI